MVANAPKVMSYNDKNRKVISIRKFIELDYISEENFALIQWGHAPVKFICYRKTSKPLYFLFSKKWSIKFSLWRFDVGHTLKPINVTPFWRKQCAIILDLDRFRHTAMTTRKVKSVTGSTTPTPE